MRKAQTALTRGHARLLSACCTALGSNKLNGKGQLIAKIAAKMAVIWTRRHFSFMMVHWAQSRAIRNSNCSVFEPANK